MTSKEKWEIGVLSTLVAFLIGGGVFALIRYDDYVSAFERAAENAAGGASIMALSQFEQRDGWRGSAAKKQEPVSTRGGSAPGVLPQQGEETKPRVWIRFLPAAEPQEAGAQIAELEAFKSHSEAPPAPQQSAPYAQQLLTLPTRSGL